MGEVILTMKNIDKSFPGVHALDHVDFELKRGEVHALMGENGAGKSTLMKVLTGIYTKDSGTITYEGREVEFHNTHDAQAAGIVIVHQELNMVGDLTVAQNIFIGREFKKGFMIDDRKMIQESKKLFDELHINIDPKAKMSDLTVGKQQMCEIAKAISHQAKVIIFDEPSAALTEKEIEELKREGVVSGGMLPKVDCCVEALRAGVRNVVIMDGRIPHSILMELLTDEGAGTMVMGGEAE